MGRRSVLPSVFVVFFCAHSTELHGKMRTPQKTVRASGENDPGDLPDQDIRARAPGIEPVFFASVEWFLLFVR